MSSIRRAVQIASSTRTVWNALLTGEGLVKWLGSEARVDGREGGRVVVKLHEGGELLGIINVWRPTAKAEIVFDKHSVAPWGGTTLTLAVARDGTDTAVHLLHAGATLDDDAASAPLDAEWKAWLLKLRDSLEA